MASRSGARYVIWRYDMGKLERIRVRRPSVLLLIDVKPASGGPRIIVPIPIAAITVLVETIGFWGLPEGLGVRLPKESPGT